MKRKKIIVWILIILMYILGITCVLWGSYYLLGGMFIVGGFAYFIVRRFFKKNGYEKCENCVYWDAPKTNENIKYIRTNCTNRKMNNITTSWDQICKHHKKK